MNYKLIIDGVVIVDNTHSASMPFNYKKSDINYLLIQVKKTLMELEVK